MVRINAGRSRAVARALAVTAAASAACVLALPVVAASASTAPGTLASSDWHPAVLPTNYYVGNGQNGPATSPVSCARGTQFCMAVVTYLPPGLSGQIPQGVVVTDDGGAHWRAFCQPELRA